MKQDKKNLDNTQNKTIQQQNIVANNLIFKKNTKGTKSKNKDKKQIEFASTDVLTTMLTDELERERQNIDSSTNPNSQIQNINIGAYELNGGKKDIEVSSVNARLMKEELDKIARESMANEIIKFLDTLTPSPFKMKDKSTEYTLMATVIINMYGMLLLRIGDILPDYDLEFLCNIKRILDRRDKLDMKDPEDQKSLFLLHHGGFTCANTVFDIESIIPQENKNTPSKALKKYKHIVQKVMEENDKILEETLKNIKDNKTKLLFELFKKKDTLYEAKKYEYESALMTLGQVIYGSAEIINLL